MCTHNIWTSEGAIWDLEIHEVFYATLWKIQTLYDLYKNSNAIMLYVCETYINSRENRRIIYISLVHCSTNLFISVFCYFQYGQL